MRIPGIPFVQGRNSYSDADGRKYGIAIHNTSNTASAEAEASYATRRTDGVSSHFYVDDNSIVQSLDTSARAGHAGSRNGNENAIAFEITGVNSWSRQQWLENVAWDQLARVLAVLCKEYGIEPRRASASEMASNPKVRAFYGHDDMRRAWGGTTHTDPGPNFPWDHLLSQVKRAMNGDLEDELSAEAEKRIEYIDGRVHALTLGRDTVDERFPGAGTKVWAVAQIKAIQAEQVAARKRDEAILAAIKGVPAAEILARIDQVAAAEAERDAKLLELVQAGQSGQLDAAEVVRQMGVLLSGTSS